MIILQPIKSKHYSVPRSLGVRLFGTLASVTGIALMGAGGLTLLKCQRPPQAAGSCQLIHTRAFAPAVQEVSLAQLRSAQLERSYRHRFHVAYQVVLVTEAGKILLTTLSPTERAWKAEVTDRINRFLQSPGQAELEMLIESRAWAEAFGFGLAAIGTVAGLLAPKLL